MKSDESAQAWIDLYMVCFDSTEQPEQLYVQLELPRIIDAEVISTQPEPEGHGFVWKNKEIRLDHMVPWAILGLVWI